MTHVFELADAEEWVVAESEEDAWAVALEAWGGKRDDFAQEDETFEQCDDDRILKIICDADGKISDSGAPVARTCAEWAAREGRGILCSGNF